LQIYISQGSVAMHSRCGAMFRNHANFIQDAQMKEFWKSVIIWRRYWQWQSGTFL